MAEVETPVAAETPVVEEVGTQEVNETEETIETPAAAAAAAAEEDPQAGGDAEDAAGKQTRAQKKMMKAMSKLNLKHVPGIMKVVMRRKGNILFSIHGGEVYKVRFFCPKSGPNCPGMDSGSQGMNFDPVKDVKETLSC